MILRIGIALAAGIAALIGGGVGYQRVAESRDRKRFPAPGRLISVDGCALHLWEQGTGGPAVILEAGIAASSLSWARVQPEIARFLRVASYDRAGLGWSSPCSRPRSLSQFTAELSVLLQNSGIPPPYVLVGHSFGGLLIRVFAHEHPAHVAGLVFVDPVSLELWANCSDANNRRLAHGVTLSRRGAWLARLGVVRLALSLASAHGGRLTKFVSSASAGRRATSFLVRLIGEIRKLPAAVLPVVASQWSSAKCFDAMALHLAALPECASGAKSLQIPSNIPLVVLSAATATEDELRERDKWVRQSPRGRHSRIGNTGHWMQLERPDVVIAAVKQIVDDYRTLHLLS